MILAGFAIVVAVAIAELVMAARWNPTYRTVGVPIFAWRVERPNELDGVSLTCGARAALALIFVAGGAFAQQPRIDSISPSQGPIAGGTIVTVGGANFAGASVALDRAAVAPLSQSDSEIRLQMAAHDNGYVVIAVRNAAGAAYREFLYVPPRLDALPPGAITPVAGVGRYDHAFGRATEAMIHANGFAWRCGTDVSRRWSARASRASSPRASTIVPP